MRGSYCPRGRGARRPTPGRLVQNDAALGCVRRHEHAVAGLQEAYLAIQMGEAFPGTRRKAIVGPTRSIPVAPVQSVYVEARQSLPPRYRLV